MPSSAAYIHRFGSLIRAYEAVGFTPDRDYRRLHFRCTIKLHDIGRNTMHTTCLIERRLSCVQVNGRRPFPPCLTTGYRLCVGAEAWAANAAI